MLSYTCACYITLFINVILYMYMLYYTLYTCYLIHVHVILHYVFVLPFTLYKCYLTLSIHAILYPLYMLNTVSIYVIL